MIKILQKCIWLSITKCKQGENSPNKSQEQHYSMINICAGKLFKINKTVIKVNRIKLYKTSDKIIYIRFVVQTPDY